MRVKLQALVYDILQFFETYDVINYGSGWRDPTTAIVDYVIGLEKLSANEQFFHEAQTAVNL